MPIIDITSNLYFRNPPPWAKKKGLVVAHKPRQTSPYLKEWQGTFASTAASLFGAPEAQGQMGMASALKSKLTGKNGTTSFHDIPGIRGVRLTDAAADRYRKRREARHRLATVTA